MAATPLTVDDYANALPDPARQILTEVRRIIASVVPGVSESIRYQMPVFSIDGMYVVYVGAWKKHLGLYPIPALPSALETKIQAYRTKVDTVRFLYSRPVPYDLIAQIVEALVQTASPIASSIENRTATGLEPRRLGRIVDGLHPRY